MSNKKAKLTTEIEKKIHNHIQMVKESTVDFTHLYLRRNNMSVDGEVLSRVLEVVRLGIESEHMNHIDRLLKELDKSINEVVED